MKSKILLLCALLMVGCGGNESSSSISSDDGRTDYNSQSTEQKTSSSTKVEETNSSSSVTDTTSSSSTSQDDNLDDKDPAPKYDNENNLVDMAKVMNLQCSKGTAYGGQYCTGDAGGYNGSWYCDWEGWWCEYTQVGDYGVDVASPVNCDYSGLESWYVQLNVPYASWKTNSTYTFAFDLKSTVDTSGEQVKITNEDIKVDMLNSSGNYMWTVGTFKANNSEYTHYEYTITTAGDLGAENYISLSLGGRGTLNYQFRNLYLGEAIA